MNKNIVVIILIEAALIALIFYMCHRYVTDNDITGRIASLMSGNVKKSEMPIKRESQHSRLYFQEVEKIAKQITPEREDEFIEQALVKMRAGDYREALKIYDAVVKANPDNKRVWMNRGSAHAWLKNYDKAIADTARSIEINPARYTAYLNRAMYYNERAGHGDFHKALADINIYITAGNFDEKHGNMEVEAYILKGQILARLEEYDKAIETLEHIEFKYIDEGQKNKEFYSWFGWSYHKLGNNEKAKEYYEKAVSAGSKYAQKQLSHVSNNNACGVR